jgi:hypothetical protein
MTSCIVHCSHDIWKTHCNLCIVHYEFHVTVSNTPDHHKHSALNGRSEMSHNPTSQVMIHNKKTIVYTTMRSEGSMTTMDYARSHDKKLQAWSGLGLDHV